MADRRVQGALPADVHLGAGPPIVLLHGFTQTRASWRPIGERLDGHTVVVPDLPGHGANPPERDHADLTAVAAAVATTLGAFGPALLVGYSMGGRVALRTALDHPALVHGLVLIGATAGIDDVDDRAARRRADASLAERIEADGVDAFLDGWLAQPLFAGLKVETDDLAGRRTNRAAGLASSLRSCGTGQMDPPWWDDLRALEVPTTVVVGERDTKFTELGRRLVSAIGVDATLEVIAGTGHACHLEDADAVTTVIQAR